MVTFQKANCGEDGNLLLRAGKFVVLISNGDDENV